MASSAYYKVRRSVGTFPKRRVVYKSYSDDDEEEKRNFRHAVIRARRIGYARSIKRK